LNRVQLSAALAIRSQLRYTPAGVAVLELGLACDGVVVEAGAERSLQFEIDAIALGEVAQRLDRIGLGTRLRLTGFLAPRSRRSRRLILHVNEFILDTGV
jgi:primosomal replication protein N